MEPYLLYITSPNREEATSLIHILLGDRLIACANMLDNATSFYWWQHEIEHHPEVMIIAKTRAELVDKVTERVKSLHSYTTPCVVAVPIVGGNQNYLEWIAYETRQE